MFRWSIIRINIIYLICNIQTCTHTCIRAQYAHKWTYILYQLACSIYVYINNSPSIVIKVKKKKKWNIKQVHLYTLHIRRSLHSTITCCTETHNYRKHITENCQWVLYALCEYLFTWSYGWWLPDCWCPPPLSSNHTAIYTRLRRVPQHGTNIEKRLDFWYPTRATNGLCDVRFFAA